MPKAPAPPRNQRRLRATHTNLDGICAGCKFGYTTRYQMGTPGDGITACRVCGTRLVLVQKGAGNA